MNSLLQDLRFAVRMFLRKPGFSLTASATLALGIGANIAIFALIYSVLFRPLPYLEPDRLAMVFETDGAGDQDRDSVSPGNFMALRESIDAFQSCAALTQEIGGFSLTGGERPVKLEGLRVSGDFFATLGVAPELGRGFSFEDDRFGAQATVVLEHGFWTDRFGGDPGILGRQLILNGEPHTVVGVTPARFALPIQGISLFVPFRFHPGQRENYGGRYLQVIARLKPGVSLETARAELDGISKGLAAKRTDAGEKWGLVAAPLHGSLVADSRDALLALFGVVGFIFLIACANVAGLFLTHSQARENEMAVRRALGASAGRLFRQLACESLVIAAVAGAMGFLLSSWGIDLLRALGLLDLPRALAVEIDAAVVLFAGATSLVGAVLVTAPPAFRLLRPGLANALNRGTRGSVASGSRLQKALVVGEVALTLIALTGAGLLLNSFIRLRAVQPGYETEKVLTLQFSLVGEEYAQTETRANFYRELEQRVSNLPGVEAAGVVSFLPLRFHGGSLDYTFEERETPPGKWQGAAYRVAGPGYLRAMRLRLLQGRFFEASEIDGNPWLAVIDEDVARRGWPNQNPIGKRLKFGDRNSDWPWMEVVGVVASGRLFDLSREMPAIYVPFTQPHSPWANPRALALRGSGPPLELRRAVEAAIWEIDPDIAVSNAETMESVVSGAVAPRRGQTFLVIAFAVVALALAAIGVYGVISFGVSQRTREIGVRMALGAQPGQILRGVLREGAWLLAAGVTLGTAGSWLLGGFLQSQLYEIRPDDPWTRLAGVALVAAATLAACWIPARRATSIDPTEALRTE